MSQATEPDAPSATGTHHGPILHVLASSHGGGAVHVRTLATGLVWRGVSVAVALPFDGGHVDANDFTRHGVAVCDWHRNDAVGSVTALAAILRLQRPRLIHTHGSRAAVLTWVAARLARASRTPQVYSAHGFVTPFHAQPRRFVQHAAERLVGRSCRAILAGSEHERAALTAARITLPERVIALPQGVDTAPFVQLAASQRSAARQRLTIDRARFVVVAVCRLDRPRDFPTLLHGFAQLVATHPHAVLLIVGDGPARHSVEASIRQLALQDRVSLVGVQRDTVPYYAAADVFVSTSNGWEALGIATIEAQAAALPVVVTDAGGAAEAFVPGSTGLLIPQQDPDALTRALRQLAADADLRRAMGDAGRLHATTHFAIAPMIDAVLAVYRTALPVAARP